jgi:hypothetical protein
MAASYAPASVRALVKRWQRYVWAGILSREKGLVRGADVVMTGGRQHRWRRYARAVGGPCAVGEPVHVRNLSEREPGDPTAARPRGQRNGALLLFLWVM